MEEDILLSQLIQRKKSQISILIQQGVEPKRTGLIGTSTLTNCGLNDPPNGQEDAVCESLF